MPEEENEAETGPRGAGIGAGPAAALALGFAAHDARVAAEAYLKSQRRLSDLQIERLQAQDRHFHEEAELELSHLRPRRHARPDAIRKSRIEPGGQIMMRADGSDLQQRTDDQWEEGGPAWLPEKK